MSKRSPYQPSIPKKKPITPPVSHGYPPSPSQGSNWKFMQNTAKEMMKATALLKDLGIENSAVDFIKLLEDEERLKVVLKKLKLKAFL